MPAKPRQGTALLLALGLLAAGPGWGASLGETQVRAFVARQERSWNAGALDAWAAGFTPDAVFIDQYRTPAGVIVPYGTSTLAKTKNQIRKFRATAKVAESGKILRLALSADGRSAQVDSQVISRTEGAKGVRVACAERRQELVLAAKDLRSRGQTDTFSRCRR